MEQDRERTGTKTTDVTSAEWAQSPAMSAPSENDSRNRRATKWQGASPKTLDLQEQNDTPSVRRLAIRGRTLMLDSVIVQFRPVFKGE